MHIFRSSSRKYDDSQEVYSEGSLHLEVLVPYPFVSVTKKRNRNIRVVGHYDKEENIFFYYNLGGSSYFVYFVIILIFCSY